MSRQLFSMFEWRQDRSWGWGVDTSTSTQSKNRIHHSRSRMSHQSYHLKDRSPVRRGQAMVPEAGQYVWQSFQREFDTYCSQYVWKVWPIPVWASGYFDQRSSSVRHTTRLTVPASAMFDWNMECQFWRWQCVEGSSGLLYLWPAGCLKSR